MTVPGKGGRPRKWRSDADRVRAFRARQRSAPEPATFEQALADGDELARALQQVRRIEADLRAAAAAADSLQAELTIERRRTATSRRRLERAESELTTLRRLLDEQRNARQLLDDEVAELCAANAAQRRRLEQLAAPRPNRADRRQAAKRDRRDR